MSAVKITRKVPGTQQELPGLSRFRSSTWLIRLYSVFTNSRAFWVTYVMYNSLTTYISHATVSSNLENYKRSPESLSCNIKGTMIIMNRRKPLKLYSRNSNDNQRQSPKITNNFHLQGFLLYFKADAFKAFSASAFLLRSLSALAYSCSCKAYSRASLSCPGVISFYKITFCLFVPNYLKSNVAAIYRSTSVTKEKSKFFRFGSLETKYVLKLWVRLTGLP